MMEEIKISKISYFSLVKLLFIGSLPVIFAFCLLIGIGVLIQGVPENPEPNNFYGWQAVWAAIFLGVVWPAMFSVIFGGIIKIGLAVVLHFKKQMVLKIAISN